MDELTTNETKMPLDEQTSSADDEAILQMDKVTTRLRKGGLLSMFGCIGGYAALNYFSNESTVARSGVSYAQKRNLFADPNMSFSNEWFLDETELIDFTPPLIIEEIETDDDDEEDDEESESTSEERLSLSSIDKEDEAHEQMAEIVQELIENALESSMIEEVEQKKKIQGAMLANMSNWLKQKMEIFTQKMGKKERVGNLKIGE